MKFILLILFSNSIFAQDYIDSFKTIALEPGVVNYQIQRSLDSLGTYTTFATILPKKGSSVNLYGTLLPVASYWWKIKTLYLTTTTYSKPIKIINTNVSLYNLVYLPLVTGDNLSFNASNESAVLYYNIKRSINLGVWTLVAQITQKGLGRYVVNISKSAGNKRYSLQAIYKNGNVSNIYMF